MDYDQGSSYTVGDTIEDSGTKAARGLLWVAAIIVYIGGIVYAEVHGYNLLVSGIRSDMVMWSILGMLALGLTALALPAALHFWFYATLQRWVGLVFYGLDFSLLLLNAVGDYNHNQGTAMPGWLEAYMTFVVPATPILVAIGWSIIMLLDPASQERASRERLKAATRTALDNQITSAARSENVAGMVHDAAEAMVDDIVRKTLGIHKVTVVEPEMLPASTDRKHGKQQWDIIRPKQPASVVTYAAEAESGKLSVERKSRPN